ncbi:head-tail connector protein [Latilactobacillus curvatus]|uniref:head-tail connector protein n=1 Tax=Latilactobacillus curvatus TaxID=28038 RepID=UPI0020C7BF68|nr:head-tail connector protein [Latilactobacillus curvatus]MCP8848940.1 head-tail connector protein [Latilactobacillus curvatus]
MVEEKPLLPPEKLETLKNYCKIDQDFDDELLKSLVNASALELARAIKSESRPTEFINEPRFFIALMKQVKEDYYLRGITADSYRPILANSVICIINQLRAEQGVEDADN